MLKKCIPIALQQLNAGKELCGLWSYSVFVKHKLYYSIIQVTLAFAFTFVKMQMSICPLMGHIFYLFRLLVFLVIFIFIFGV